MAVDPRLERLPEHQGPAFRTWQLIMQTTMGKVMQPPSPPYFQFNSTGKGKPAEDYISLKSSSEDGEDDDDKENIRTDRTKHNMKRKKDKHVGSDSSEDEDDRPPVAPWKKNPYPEDAYG